MKVLSKLFALLVTASLPTTSHAFPELPFCPAGGPPGWMNHYNYKRDQNIWRRYSQYALPAYNQPANYWPNSGYGYTPAYLPYYNRPYNYSWPPYNYNRNYSRPGTAPSRYN